MLESLESKLVKKIWTSLSYRLPWENPDLLHLTTCFLTHGSRSLEQTDFGVVMKLFYYRAPLPIGYLADTARLAHLLYITP